MTDKRRSDVQDLIELEKRFWQAMVDGQTDLALELLEEPAALVGPQGASRFDHATYRKMAEHGVQVVKSFVLSEIQCLQPTPDVAVLVYRVQQQVGPRGKPASSTQHMRDSSTWVRRGGRWRCVLHTETPVPAG
jgi:ketosteroid isomerase-like protein